jgi:hypothetical protein
MRQSRLPARHTATGEFSIRNLSVLAYAQGFTLWHYKALGMPLNSLTQAGFFDHATDMLAPGDMLMMSGSDGGKIAFVTQASPCVQLAPLA